MRRWRRRWGAAGCCTSGRAISTSTSSSASRRSPRCSARRGARTTPPPTRFSTRSRRAAAPWAARHEHQLGTVARRRHGRARPAGAVRAHRQPRSRAASALQTLDVDRSRARPTGRGRRHRLDDLPPIYESRRARPMLSELGPRDGPRAPSAVRGRARQHRRRAAPKCAGNGLRSESPAALFRRTQREPALRGCSSARSPRRWGSTAPAAWRSTGTSTRWAWTR